MSLPLVSVLMPVRDAAGTIEASLRSALEQDWPAFEVLLVDDGSADGSIELAHEVFGAHQRLRVVPSTGRGLVAALNTGLRLAKGEYIARLDADDLAHGERLSVQIPIIEKCPEAGLIGARARAFPESGLKSGMRHYLAWQDSCITPTKIAEQIYVESPFVHSTVTFRRKVVLDLGGYHDGEFPEDYELWLRMHAAGIPMLKVDQSLVEWRQSDASFSKVDSRYSREAFDRVRAEYLSQDPRLHQGRPLVIWGAGRRTRMRCRHLLDKGFAPVSWIDIDPKKIGNIVQGARVESPKWLEGARLESRPFVLSYVANHGAAELIEARLHEMGYCPGTDYLLVG